MKNIARKIWPHLTALVTFILISLAFMSPVLEGKILNQPDQVNWIGMAQEIQDHREVYDEDPLWTNSMFGGMPATQISIQYPGRIASKISIALKAGLPRPAEMLFLYFISFYIMLLCLRINPWLALAGAVFFGFSSYLIIILVAGHNAKAVAIAYMAPVIGSFILAYRSKLWLGIGLSALFMGLQLNSNHPQISYYLAIILVSIGFVELTGAFKRKELPYFGKATILLFGAYGLSFLMTCGNLFSTMDYTSSTIRGKSELTLKPDSTAANSNQTSGLDIDYATQWSNGINESFTFVIPNAKGGETQAIGNGIYRDDIKKVPRKFQNAIAGSNQYWGDQPFTSGPVYLGVIIFLLFLLGMIYIKDNLKWGLLAACILGLFLSWGHNFLPLTKFFLEYIPLYNKFRSVSMTLVILEVCIPLIAILFLSELVNNKERIKAKPKGIYIVCGGMLLLFTVCAISPNLMFNFLSENEIASYYAQLDNYEGNAAAEASILDQMDELESFRIGIFQGDVKRGILFLLLGVIAPLFFFVFSKSLTKTASLGVISWICLMAVIDLWGVDKRYLNNEATGSGKTKVYKQWIDKIEKDYPWLATSADNEVIQREQMANPDLQDQISKVIIDINNKYPRKLRLKKATKQKIIDQAKFSVLNRNTNYRVFDQSGGFSSSRASYFHKSIGGYHGAKLRRYQEIIDFHLTTGNMSVYNMLNTKYFFSPSENGQLNVNVNPGAMGNAWFVNDVTWAATPDEEILSLHIIDPKASVVLNEKYRKELSKEKFNASNGSISMTNYKANEIKYDFSANDDQLVVFSEIYYKEGWKAEIDGKEANILQGDYILRVLEVPAGDHEIVFSYSDDRIDKYGMIMLISSILVILIVLSTLYFELKNWYKKEKLVPNA